MYSTSEVVQYATIKYHAVFQLQVVQSTPWRSTKLRKRNPNIPVKIKYLTTWFAKTLRVGTWPVACSAAREMLSSVFFETSRVRDDVSGEDDRERVEDVADDALIHTN
jgi:hypothetical protein